MSSSPDAPVLRGAVAAAFAPARLDADLRHSRFLRAADGSARLDPRLADPRLEAAFEEAAEEVRTAARAQGYAEGWAAGQAAALADAEQRAAALAAAHEATEASRSLAFHRSMDALVRAAGELERRALPQAEEVRDVVVEAALALAAAVLGREVSLDPEPGRSALLRALDLAPDGSRVLVRLNPADHAALVAASDGASELMVDGRQVVLAADPSVAVGSAVADCDATRVDARLETALQRAREVLLP